MRIARSLLWLAATVFLAHCSLEHEPAPYEPAPEGVSVGALETLPANAIGIWYSTWYANEGRYRWLTGHGVGSNRQLMGDVNGDGKADAIAYFASSGAWYAALSNGNGFNNYSQWASGHGTGSNNQLLADVNGDGRADAVVFFSNSGTWYVALSNGNGFNNYSQWISGHGAGSNNQLLADVHGDGRADAIVYFASSGAWYVAASTGGGFASYALWSSGHGVGSSHQFLADVHGDGRADAIAFFGSGGLSGSWYVAPSTGNSFASYGHWASGFGAGATPLVGDANGDGRADAVSFSRGTWSWAKSNGGVFLAGQVLAVEHGIQLGNGHGANASAVFLADVKGRGAKDGVVYTAADGSWRALPWPYQKPNRLNTWEAWNIAYVPRTLGVYRQYDSGEASVIDEHLTMIKDAKIDFLLFDETNNLHVDGDYIFQRALAVCRRIQARRAVDPLVPRYAIAVGGIQYTNPANPAVLESEAAEVYDRFVTAAECGGVGSYAHVGGKPLLVVYAELGQRRAWEGYTGDKTASSRFTLRWAQGVVGPTSTTGCSPAQGAVPGSDYGLYYGWGTLDGALPDSRAMMAMPGWYNHGSCFVSRQNGAFYQAKGWDRIHATRPAMAIINSFNEYAEETAVAPTDSSGARSPSERWSDPDFYWNATRTHCARRKGL